MADPLLRVENLVRRFGGIIATDNLSLDVAPGELHAIIGPNGAGKTTLISQLTGQLMPNSGTIHFAGRDITRLPAYRRSAARPGALVPDHLAAAGFHGVRTMSRSRRKPMTATRSASGALRARRAHLRDAAQAALTRVGLDQTRRRAGVRVEPWRAARARAGGGARDQTAIAAARRADGGPRRHRNPRAWWRC